MNIEKFNNVDLRTSLDGFFLRILKPEDVSQNYLNWLNDKEVIKYLESRFIENNIRNLKKNIREKYESKSELFFGIFHEKSHIGNIKLGPINFQHKISEIGCLIGEKKYWGKGVMTAAIKCITNFSFNTLRLEKLTSGCYSNNTNSIKLFLKCGFNIEGTRKKQVIFENIRIDTLIFGILRRNNES